MALNISAGAIRNPILPTILMLALIFAGFTAYGRLPINQLPNVDFGGITVTVAQPGAAPAEMETQITQRIEAALTAVEGVERVISTISPGRYLRYRLALGALPSLAAARARFVARIVHRDPESWAEAVRDLIAWHGSVRDEGAEWPGRAAQEAAVDEAETGTAGPAEG